MLLKLFLVFFKIGIFTIGGGYAMIPLIEKELIENKKWIDKDELIEILTISQMTPGPIATNAATFIGNKMKGIPGAIFSTIGVVMPSLIIITFIAAFLSVNFDNIYVQKVFIGLRAGMIAIILFSVKKLSKSVFIDKISYIYFFITMYLLIFTNFSPIYIISISGFISIIIYSISKGIKK